MANRSFLMLCDETSQKKKILSEWNYTIPLVYYFLIGFETELIHDESSETVEIQGDWERGLTFLTTFLDWFGSVNARWSKDCQGLKSLLNNLNFGAAKVILNAMDVYSMNERETVVQQAQKDLEISKLVIKQVLEMMQTSHENCPVGAHWVVKDSFDDVGLYMGINNLAWD